MCVWTGFHSFQKEFQHFAPPEDSEEAEGGAHGEPLFRERRHGSQQEQVMWDTLYLLEDAKIFWYAIVICQEDIRFIYVPSPLLIQTAHSLGLASKTLGPALLIPQICSMPRVYHS